MDSENPNPKKSSESCSSSKGSSSGSKRKWLVIGGLVVALVVGAVFFFSSNSDSDLQGNVRSRGGRVQPPAPVVVIDEANCSDKAFLEDHETECDDLFEKLALLEQEESEAAGSEEEDTTYLIVGTYEPLVDEAPVEAPVAAGTVSVALTPGFSTAMMQTIYDMPGFFITNPVAAYTVSASGEDFVVDTITLENDSDESNPLADDAPIQNVTIRYYKYSPGSPTGYTLTTAMAPFINGQAIFTGLNLLASSTLNLGIVQVTLQIDDSIVVGGTQQVEIDFPSDGAFLATGLTSGTVITQVGNTQDVDAPNVTLVPYIPPTPPPAAPAPSSPAGSGSYTPPSSPAGSGSYSD